MTRLDRRQAITLALAASAAAPLSPALARKPLRTPQPAPLRYPIRLNANENPWGPGPMARAAIAATTDEASRYGMDVQARLVEAIAAHERIEKDRIVVGSGSGELLNMLALAWCERGQLVCAWPTYGQMMALAEKFGCETRKVPVDAELRHDLGALAAATTPNTSLLYVCNPNNPTGTVVAGAPLLDFCRQMSQRTLVVVDEAYLDLVEEGATASMAGLVHEGENVVVLRTFSKIHGLAGMRIGYALARPDVAQRLRRLQLTAPGILGMAAATASLGDAQFLADTRTRLLADRRRVCEALDDLKLPYARPQGNFVFVKVGMPVADFRARMKEQQIEVGRPFEPLLDWCRITIGTSDETTVFIDALRKVIRT
jgi:histidinol-phosphate aminotransferase